MSALEVAGVTKSFGRTTALAHVDLSVPAGTVAAVLGPSGCGKTTLLRVIAGFERADAGEVSIGGRCVARPGMCLPPERRGAGIVPQEVALFPHLSVAGNVAFALQRSRRPRRRRRSPRVAELLELVGLAGMGERRPHELSGGQQQRVAVARALAADPTLILLDEPFGSLDAGLRTTVRNDVLAALRTAGATGVLVTHDQHEALSAADVVAVLRDGRVAQVGSPPQLYRRPADLGVATFVGESMLLPATVHDRVATCVLGRLPVADGLPALSGRATVVLRPEQLDIDIDFYAAVGANGDRAGKPAAGTAEATVVAQTFLGCDTLFTVELDDGTRLTSRRRSGASVALGDGVALGRRVAVTCRSDVLAYHPDSAADSATAGTRPDAGAD